MTAQPTAPPLDGLDRRSDVHVDVGVGQIHDNLQVQGITIVQFDKYLSVEPTRS
jgi:hypothetical protein